MHGEDEHARGRIGRIARQLLRQERRAQLHDGTGQAEHAQAIVASARTVHLGAIAAHAQQLEDEEVRARCAELLDLYNALGASASGPDALDRAHAALVELVIALPPPSAIARVRVAVRAEGAHAADCAGPRRR